jgi:two-component system, chemotaxis family, protein-glutamate methylesterase/glutaminase
MHASQTAPVVAAPTIRPYQIVVIAASAGGVHALGEVLAALPEDFPAAVAIVQHRSPHGASVLPAVLQRRTALHVKAAEEGERLRPGHVYVAPPDHHLKVLRNRSFEYGGGGRIRHVLSSANPLFESAAAAFGRHVIAVVLTGLDSDGTDGVQSIKRAGGLVIAQDEATSAHFGMPAAAIMTGCVDRVLPLEQIGPTLVQLCGES